MHSLFSVDEIAYPPHSCNGRLIKQDLIEGMEAMGFNPVSYLIFHSWLNYIFKRIDPWNVRCAPGGHFDNMTLQK